MDYIKFFIPVFFLLIGIELLISRLKNTQLYRLNDAVTNISCGIAQQVTGVFFKSILFVAYYWLFTHYKLAAIPDTVISYIILFVGIDFFYYWFHRLAHEVNIFWGTHIVHHQSEEYNFSVALRQSSFQAFVSTIFYLPLAIIGFNPAAFITISSFQTLYQFWIHTKAIDRLPGPFEFIFNTPSHHRVHHGRNPKYIDKNHGGTLIIFDRMFGTFQKEEEEVIYGVTKPLASWNPVWANFDYFNDLRKEMKRATNWKDKLLYLVKPPGWQPLELGGRRYAPEVSDQDRITYDTSISANLNYYILSQYVVLLVIASWFLFNTADMIHLYLAGFTAFILLTLVSMGGIFEKRSWVTYAEFTRYLLLLGLLFQIDILPSPWSVLVGLFISAMSILSYFFFLRSD